MAPLTRVIVGKASAVVAVLLLGLGIALIAGLGTLDHTPRVDDGLPRGYDSTRAAQLRDQLPADEGSTAVVLFTARSGNSPLSAATVAELDRVVRDLRVPHVSAPAGPQAVLPSKDGTAAISVLAVDRSGASALKNAVVELRDRLDAAAPAGIRAEVTGPAAVKADLSAVFDGANVRLLAVTASVVALLLVITYRSPVLWLVPLIVVGVADQVAAVLATHTLAGISVPFDGSTTGILSVLVFGAGTDYALLLISRYRDELRTHEDRYDAMRLALRRTAHAVLSSATTVVLGVLTLALSLTPTTRGLGIACAVGIVVAAVFALVALPAALVLFGRWVFWPKVPHVGSAALADGRSPWRRVGDAVAARRGWFAVGAVAVLAVLSVGLADTKAGLPTAEQFLKKPEAISAGQRLAEHFPAGASDPATVITRSPEAATSALQQVSGVEDVRPGSSAKGWSELSVVLSDAPDSAGARATVERMRTALADVPGQSFVGGTAAQNLDLSSASSRDRWVIFPAILVLVLGALVLLLRSVVAPVLLVLTVLATYVAAMGAGWWMFRAVFAFSAVDESMPLFAFLFLVALGVDYNIFLVTRAWEETPGHGSREGMIRALAATGGVITSAGILLAAVFAVLGVLPLVVLAQLGVVIGIGVLLDTLLVRTVLVPALALLLGDRFWWPRRLPTG
ncbi:MAG TPA: MMPL family transporter [Marmoricola sp.]|nr:MMPL family transporter [Marmoricola sp.]